MDEYALPTGGADGPKSRVAGRKTLVQGVFLNSTSDSFQGIKDQKPRQYVPTVFQPLSVAASAGSSAPEVAVAPWQP